MLFYRHIFSEWAKVFLMTLGVILGLLLMDSFFNDLKRIMSRGADLEGAIKYFIIYIPSVLPSILPMIFMISILFSLGTLHKNNEIIAMRALGLSLWRIAAPIWTVAVLLTGFLLYLNAQIVPWSVEETNKLYDYYKFQDQIEKTGNAEEVGLIYNLTFYNHKDKRLWFMNRFSQYNYRAYGITVHEMNEDNKEVRRIMASEGFFDETDQNWTFLKGQELLLDPIENTPLRLVRFDEKIEDSLSENPELMKFRQKKPKNLSFFQLKQVTNTLSSADDPGVRAFEVQYHTVLSRPFISLIVAGLAIPFAVSGVRVNPMVGISKAFGLFIFFFVANSIFSLMGAKNILSPATAAWAPSIMMLILSIYFARKAR